MKKNIYKNLTNLLKSKMVLMVSVSLMATSCVVYTGGYSETDGVYYDPNRDTLPEGTMADRGNRVGEYYDYQDTLFVENTYPGQVFRSGKYKGWDQDDKYSHSDWGTYAGTETNIYNNYYGGYSFYPRFGFGGYFGMSYGWGSPFYSMFYDPFWGFNYYSFGYSPYNWYYGGYYNPYYGYGGGYYNPYYYREPLAYKRSGSVGGFKRSGTNTQGIIRNRENEGFRTVRSYNHTNNSVDYRRSQNNDGQRRVFRNEPRNTRSTQSRTPIYRNETRSDSWNNNVRSGSDGFRSPSTNSGTMRSGSNGSTRSGGFRR